MPLELYRSSTYHPKDVVKRYVAWAHWYTDGLTRCTVYEVNAKGQTIREYADLGTIPSSIVTKARLNYENRIAFGAAEWPPA